MANTTNKKEFFFFLVFLPFSMVVPMVYGGSLARGLIRAVAASLRQSHSNVGSEPRLRLTPQLTATAGSILNSLSEARDQTCVLMDTSRVCYH